MLKLGLETESLHLFFQQGVMDIFSFIDKTWQLGLDGVQINIIPDVGLHPEFGTLQSDSPEYLRRVRDAIESRGLYCELDTRFTTPEALEKAVYFAEALGADTIRTYMFKLGTYDVAKLPDMVANLKQSVDLLQRHRIRLAIENHEEETADELISVIQAVNSRWVGAHLDIGNGMMAYEDPITTCKKLAPYAYGSHFKDHLVTRHEDQLVVTGAPLCEGTMPVEECFKILIQESGLTRINLETCYPYSSRFGRPVGTGGVTEMTGAFAPTEPPFDYNEIKPLDYYYPDRISQQALKTLMAAQERCVRLSVQKLFEWRQKYCA